MAHLSLKISAAGKKIREKLRSAAYAEKMRKAAYETRTYDAAFLILGLFFYFCLVCAFVMSSWHAILFIFSTIKNLGLWLLKLDLTFFKRYRFRRGKDRWMNFWRKYRVECDRLLEREIGSSCQESIRKSYCIPSVHVTGRSSPITVWLPGWRFPLASTPSWEWNIQLCGLSNSIW